MVWRLASSLETLRKQVNGMAPNRNKVSDGSVGDPAHASRPSDHNPNKAGVVQALDLTHDPAHGFDSWAFAEHLRLKRDPRIKYVISNGRIFASTTSPWQWRPYTGTNKHSHHVHISVLDSPDRYNDPANWDIAGDWNAGKETPFTIPDRPVLRQGAQGDAVKKLQAALNIAVDGYFGPKTRLAVIAFQQSKGLAQDGGVGPYTLDAIEGK